MKQVIHIYGAAGSGTSTLGRYISEKLGYFLWIPTIIFGNQLIHHIQKREIFLLELNE